MKRKADDYEFPDDTGTSFDAKSELGFNKPDYSDPAVRVKCPYLDTINRQMIDFDSEKLCSVTLTNMNVYVCLVCGKYFHGRGKSTPAFTHSVQAGHFVFMNLQSSRTYCLPDGYEVIDSSMQNVQKCLSPKFSLEDISALNSNTSLARDVYGVSYLPGFVGLNNLNCTDYLNSLLHAISHVAPFRDYWLQSSNYSLNKSSLVQQFGLTLRKMWSANNFKSTVSPQELMQEIAVLSKKRFRIGQRSECLDLFVWLMGILHRGLGSSAKAATVSSSSNSKNSTASTSVKKTLVSPSLSVVYEPFQGIVEVTSLTKKLVSNLEEKRLLQQQQQDKMQSSNNEEEQEWVRTVTQMPFNYLSIDIPACPLFRDSEGGLVIPQVPLFEVLKKFDGTTWTDVVSSEAHIRRQYRILQLPRYLLLHLVRFTSNNFYLEKNPTIITFPVKNLEMRDFLYPATTGNDDDMEEEEEEEVDDSSKRKNNHRSGSNYNIGMKKQKEIQRMTAICPKDTAELESMKNTALRAMILQLGSELHKIQLASLTDDEDGNEINYSKAGTISSASSSSSLQRQQQQQQRTSEQEETIRANKEHLLRLRLLQIASDVLLRVQLLSMTKYDLLANVCHDSTSSAKGVTIGDLNMLLGQSAATRRGGNDSTNAGNTTTTTNHRPSTIGTVDDISSENGPTAAHTSMAAAASNNRVLNEGSYKVHIQHKATGQWFEMQDLRVSEVTPQLIGVSESNILIYEKKSLAVLHPAIEHL